MRIEENKVYVFSFNTGEHGDLAIPVRGETQQAAAQKLQDMFARMQTELAMEFPKVQPGVGTGSTEPVEIPAADGLSDILLDRINVLLADLGAKGLTDKTKAETVKNWTELEFVPANYSKIVHALELIASGGKEMPVESKSKKK